MDAGVARTFSSRMDGWMTCDCKNALCTILHHVVIVHHAVKNVWQLELWYIF